jgi:hypothetical protein
MKYALKDSTKNFMTFSCPVGKWNRTEKHSIANISIRVEGVLNSELRLNRNMLRQVLLENPNEVRDLLGLVVKPYEEKKSNKTIKTEEVGFGTPTVAEPVVAVEVKPSEE